jgi:hypothetical protein
MTWKEIYTFDGWSVASLKLAMIFFTLVVMKLWIGLANWVYDINVWWFILAFILFSIKPLKSCFGKHKKAKRK